MERIKELLIRYRSVAAYLIFGVLTTLINVAVYWLLTQKAGAGNIISTALAWIAAVTFAFLTNKPFVYGSRDWSLRATAAEARSFFSARAGTGILELILMAVFVDGARIGSFGFEGLHFNGTVMKLATNVIVIILNYIAGKFIFKNKK